MPEPTLLIVDDEPLVRWSLRERFVSDGFRVLEAASVAEAMAQASPVVDVVLLDCCLPDGEGHAVLTPLLARAPGAAVILMTACLADDEADARVQGARVCLCKPFDLDRVSAAVAAACRSDRPAACACHGRAEVARAWR